LLEKHTVRDDNGTTETYTVTYAYGDDTIVKYEEFSSGRWERYTDTYDAYSMIMEQKEEYSEEENNEAIRYTYTLIPE
jgi:hypothetical protein